MNTFKGTGIAIVTPFTANLEIDYDTLGKLIEYWIQGGVDYLVVMGTTGESVTLNKEEKKALLNFCVKTINGRIPLVLGLGGNYTAEIIESLQSFDLNGVSAILSVSPYYNKPNQRGIYEHFKAISQASPLPIILYNVPGRTGSNMLPKTTLQLANDFENIIGIKEASGNLEQITDIIISRPENFLVISGDDNLTLPTIASGGDGLISVVANAYPAAYSTMVKHCLIGDYKSALALHHKYFNLVKLLFADGSPGGIKAVLKAMNLCSDVVRPPLYKVSEEIEKQIITFVKQHD